MPFSHDHFLQDLSHPAPRRSRPLGRDLLFGAASGLLAMAVTGLVDKALTRLVSDEQKRRERRVRDGSPHDVAGPRFARQLLHREPTDREKTVAKGAFGTLYGLAWGGVYALVRRYVPGARRLYGLPFALPFFAACDGGIAPRLGLTPGLRRIPWQFNLKELANHAAWTASAELLMRAARRWRSSR